VVVTGHGELAAAQRQARPGGALGPAGASTSASATTPAWGRLWRKAWA
jgi:hypothetical protein